MFFCSWGIWWSFFSRWLTDPTHGLGMSSAEQGQIYSINSLATLVIMFVYGTIQAVSYTHLTLPTNSRV